MVSFKILDRTIFIDESNGDFSLSEEWLCNRRPMQVAKAPEYTTHLYKSVTFCLEISDACNLRCRYCFNGNKSGKKMSFDIAKDALDMLFSTFSSAEKYFIDLSGAGEPLLNLDLIERLAKYASEKSDELDREVTVCFVSNGVLLSSSMAQKLQSLGVLFGVSLDGPEQNHDAFRVFPDGKGTHKLVLDNAKSIQHRQFVGCAVTLTRNRFPLLETIEELGQIFMTISIKPVRSTEYGLDKSAIIYWGTEYERLERHLSADLSKGNTSMLFRLINGDDYFGKFILRSFLNLKAWNRCDGACGRITVSIDGRYYPCPALIGSDYELGDIKKGFNKSRAKAFYDKQIERKGCRSCAFRFSCGGECPALSNQPDPNMCDFKKKLILLSMLLKEECYTHNPFAFQQVTEFCLQKMMRNEENKMLREYRTRFPEMNFTELKKRFDAFFPQY